jgi:UDP-glucose 4-epimerase
MWLPLAALCRERLREISAGVAIGQTCRMAMLVTGGAGYIGSHTVRLLRERGREVAAFDSMEFGHRAAVGDVPLVIGDVGDPRAVADAVERYGINAVVHFAAYNSPGESMSKPQR